MVDSTGRWYPYAQYGLYARLKSTSASVDCEDPVLVQDVFGDGVDIAPVEVARDRSIVGAALVRA
jgi:hypothetical protein